MNKKLLYFTFGFSLICFGAFAQQQCKMNSFLVKEVQRPHTEKLDVLVKGDLQQIQQYLRAKGGQVKYSAGSIAAITIPVKEVQSFSLCNFVERIEYTKNNLRTLDDSSLKKNNILPIHAGTSLPQAYTGKNVIVGIIDTGTDFTHPDFKDSLGKSRIQWLWDQRSGASPSSPQPYNYGIEWSKQKIDSGLCTHVDNLSMGHGTKVAGVAAGNGRSAAAYKGIAPEADIITVAIDFNSNGPVITDAINYIITKSTALAKPFVINISLGDYYGTHDAKDLQAQMIETMMGNTPGRALVAAGGNHGDNSVHHLGYTVGADTSFTFINNSTNFINFQVCADTATFKNVFYTFGLYDSNLQYKGNVGFRKVFSSIGTVVADTLRYNGNQYGIVQSYCDNYGGSYFLDVLFTPDSLDYLWTFEATGTGRLDSWGNDFISSSLPTVSQFPRMAHYKRSDSLQTICSSYQCSDKVITVANYTDRMGFTDVSNTYAPAAGIHDSIAPTSSLGPTRDGRMKPDIAATGENIATTGSSYYMSWLIANYPFVVTQDSLHMIFGGTSAASPAVAGFVALYLQKNPTATAQMIKQDIINCSKQDIYTGTVPNPLWGHGKLDGHHALLCNTIGVSQFNSGYSIEAYPNPATNEINILTASEAYPLNYTLFDVMGKTVAEGRLISQQETIKLNELSNGVYMMRVRNNNGILDGLRIVKQQ